MLHASKKPGERFHAPDTVMQGIPLGLSWKRTYREFAARESYLKVSSKEE